MSDQDEAEVDETDPMTAIQNYVAQLYPGSMPLNVITIVEWLDEDGDYSFSIMHTPMPPWHMKGVMSYAAETWEEADSMWAYASEGEIEDDQ